MQDVYLLMTADCETARSDLPASALAMSASGPADYQESERSMRGYAGFARRYGFPLTLFVHPEVARANSSLLIELKDEGACLGLHLHPYKFLAGAYQFDLGYYSAVEQRKMLSEASALWEDALGFRPRYFRAGYFSANDSTFRVLSELGFLGGRLSLPDRLLPPHQSVWVGAPPYPHRVHLDFRLMAGDSDFVEVPVAVDYEQPFDVGHAGDRGHAWPYVPAGYPHKQAIWNIVNRIRDTKPPIGVIVLDTHNDQDYLDPMHPASQNLELILSEAVATCNALDMKLTGATVESIRGIVLGDRS